jgi:hypothetical protein
MVPTRRQVYVRNPDGSLVRGIGLDRHRRHRRHLQLGENPCALTSSPAGPSPTTS